jgi:hypothetical protein
MSTHSKKPPRTSSHPAIVAYRKQIDDVDAKTAKALSGLNKGLDELLEKYLMEEWMAEREPHAR